MNKVKSKKKKQVGPRRRYKNKGFYESSSGEDSDAEDKPVIHKRQAGSRIRPSRKVGNCYGLKRMPVLMHLKQEEAPRNTQEEADGKSGTLLHFLDPFGIPVELQESKQEKLVGCKSNVH